MMLHQKTKALQMQPRPRLTAAKNLPTNPPAIIEAKARNRCLKLIKITGT
jgi:hypothetical protein